MKRLMFLGGGRFIVPAIESAKKQGYHTITCDNIPNNYAHSYSDDYCNVSIIDKDAVLKESDRLRIDGIVSFAVDPGVTTAAYVAEKMGLPSVGPYKSVCILQNKSMFRSFLRDNGFRTPFFASYSSYESVLSDIERFKFPLIIKPVDGSGSKGVTRVDCLEEIPKAFEAAKDRAFCKEVIIEEYIEKKGFSSDADSFSLDGEMVITSFNSQLFDDKAPNPYVPAGFMWPSSISKKNQCELEEEIKRLIQLLGMRTAIYNIETRENKDGNPYIMECTPRAGGNRLAEMIKYITDVDMITAYIRGAVGDAVEKMVSKPSCGNWGEIILHPNRCGRFEKLWLSEEIKPFVFEYDLWVKEREYVNSFESASQAIGTLIVNLDDQEKLSRIMKDIRSHVRVEMS